MTTSLEFVFSSERGGRLSVLLSDTLGLLSVAFRDKSVDLFVTPLARDLSINPEGSCDRVSFLGPSEVLFEPCFLSESFPPVELPLSPKFVTASRKCLD